MAGTVKVPLLGEVKKSTAVTVGVFAAAAVVIVVIRQRQAKTAVPAPAAKKAAAPAEIPPLPAASGGSSAPFYGLGGPGTVPPGPGGFVNNAEWAQYVERYLTDTVGTTSRTLSEALGRYLTGRPLSAAQVQLVEQAIAFAEYPPVAGPGGFPPSFRTEQPAGGHPKPKRRVRVPNVVGKSLPAARDALADKHLRARPARADIKIVGAQHPKAGADVKEDSVVTLYAAAHHVGGK